MSKFQVIHQSSPKRCEICHCADMFDPETETCGRCDGWNTDYQPACVSSNYQTDNTMPSDGEFSFDIRFRASIALLSILCFLVLLTYLIFFPDVPNTLHTIAGILLGLTPGFLAIIIQNSRENINLFDKFIFCASCLVIFMMIFSLSFPQINKFVARDIHLIFLFSVSLFFGFVYESIFRIRKTISRFEVPILSLVTSSLFMPLIDGFATQSFNGTISIPSKSYSLVTFVLFFFFNYFLVDKFWEKTKISAS